MWGLKHGFTYLFLKGMVDNPKNLWLIPL